MRPTGRFLTLPSPETVLGKLEEAAGWPLPSELEEQLKEGTVEAQALIQLLSSEDETQSGYWRGALATLLAAKENDWTFSDIPMDLVERATALAERAKQSQPNLYTPQFNLQCAEFLAQVESRLDEVATGDPSDEAPSGRITLTPRRIVGAGSYPAIRQNKGGSYASATFSLLGADDVRLFEQELVVEDLVFIARSALISARAAITDATRTLKDPTLHQGVSREVFLAQLEELRSEIAGLHDLAAHFAHDID